MSVTAKFTETVIANVEPSVKQYVEQQADEEQVSMSTVIRRLLDAAITREKALTGSRVTDTEQVLTDLLRRSDAAEAAQRFADEAGGKEATSE